jgi:hypothetical protein
MYVMSWRFNGSKFRADDRQPDEAMWNPAVGEFVSHPTSLHLTAHLQQNSQHYSSSAVFTGFQSLELTDPSLPLNTSTMQSCLLLR